MQWRKNSVELYPCFYNQVWTGMLKRCSVKQYERGWSKLEFVFALALICSVQYSSKHFLRLHIQWQRLIPNGNTKKIGRNRSRFITLRRNLIISRCCFVEDGKEMYKELFNARAQLLSRPLNLVFGGFLVVVVIVVCLGSLFFLTTQSFLPEK